MSHPPSAALRPSFSRPRVSNDNPFSESALRTMKYVPFWPDKPFTGLEDARAWAVSYTHLTLPTNREV